MCAFTMGAELVAPFCIFLPRHARHVGAAVMIVLQLGIILTGNFAFFNWLTIALCFTLFEDRFWSRRSSRSDTADPATLFPRWKYMVAAAIAALDLIATVP